MEKPTYLVVADAIETFGVSIEELNQMRIQIPQNNKHISLESATKNIAPIKGGIQEARVFTDQIIAAYKKINPIEIETFYKIIRSKITGTAADVISDNKTNFQDLIIELNHKYPEPALDWEYEIAISKQQFYENPMHFGKRLEKIKEYSREGHICKANNAEIQPCVVRWDWNILEKKALRRFKETLANDYVKKLVNSDNSTTLQRAIELVKDFYNHIEWTNRYTLNVVRNVEFKCMYCEDQENHYFDCPFLP